MTTGKEWCILRSKGSSWHSFVYPSASVRAIWLRCGLKWRDFCINGKALTQKVSPFLRLPKGVTEHEAGKTGLGKIPDGTVPGAGLSGIRSDPGGCGKPTGEIRCQRAARWKAEERFADLSGAVRRFSGVDSDFCGCHFRLYGRCGKHGRYSGGHHHERNSWHHSDRQGSRLTGQPEADVRPHRQGAAGRSNRTDSGAGGGSR